MLQISKEERKRERERERESKEGRNERDALDLLDKFVKKVVEIDLTYLVKEFPVAHAVSQVTQV